MITVSEDTLRRLIRKYLKGINDLGWDGPVYIEDIFSVSENFMKEVKSESKRKNHMKVYVVREGYGMEYYGSSIQIHETDLSLKEFVEQYAENAEDHGFCPMDDEPELCSVDQNTEGGTTDTYILVGEESNVHFIPEK